MHVLNRLFVLLTLSLGALTATADKTSEIQQLLKTSGLEAQIAMIPEQFSQGVEQSIAQSGGPAAIGDQIMSAVGERIKPSVFLDNLTTAFAAGLTEDDLTSINKWYATPLASKITEIEVNVSSAEQTAYVMENMDSLLSDHERIAMARRIEEVLGGSEMMLVMMRNMQVAMINTLMADAPEAQRQTVMAQIDQQLEMAMPQFTEMLLAVHVHTYSELSDAELDKYLEFLATPAATKFYDISVRSMGTTIGHAVGQIAPAIEQMTP